MGTRSCCEKVMQMKSNVELKNEEMSKMKELASENEELKRQIVEMETEHKEELVVLEEKNRDTQNVFDTLQDDHLKIKTELMERLSCESDSEEKRKADSITMKATLSEKEEKIEILVSEKENLMLQLTEQGSKYEVESTKNRNE